MATEALTLHQGEYRKLALGNSLVRVSTGEVAIKQKDHKGSIVTGDNTLKLNPKTPVFVVGLEPSNVVLS